MEKLEKVVQERVNGSNAILTGISLGASSLSGDFEYSQVIGPLSTSPDSRPLTEDDVFWIASCTKLLTTICMLQCIEKRLFTLDQDITTVLPEWKNPNILTGFREDTGEPILKKARNKITIRHLLTHSAGFGGPRSMISQYQKWANAPPKTANSTLEELSSGLLVYEPGESWQYSSGIDWAGKMIERVTGQKLSLYMYTHIFAPLSMTSSTFRQSDIIDRLVPTTERISSECEKSNGSNGATGRLVSSKSFWLDGVTEDFGGGGAYSIVRDYMKVLRSIMKNDGVLLGSKMVKEMFKPHLTPKSHSALNSAFYTNKFSAPFYASITGNPAFFENENDPRGRIEVDWGLGGLFLMEDVENGRRKGSLSWSGLPNLYWWIDPTTGICGMYGTQLIPAGDSESARMNSDFEKAVYQELSWSSWIKS